MKKIYLSLLFVATLFLSMSVLADITLNRDGSITCTGHCTMTTNPDGSITVSDGENTITIRPNEEMKIK